MKDKKKTKQQLLLELSALREEMAALRKTSDSPSRVHECFNESEDKFRLIFDNMGDAVFVRTLSGYIIEANRAACERLGYSREELIGMKVQNIIGDNYSGRIDLRAVLIMRHKQLSYESENKAKDGTIIPIEVTARLVKFHGVDAILAISRDISERKLAQKALLESEERYRTAVENSNDGVLVSVSGKIVFCNNRLAVILGYDNANDLLGGGRYFFVDPSDLDRVREMHDDRLAGKAVPDRYEVRGVRKDGGTIIIEASVAKTLFEGEPASLAYIRDITGRKRTEEDLRKSEDMYRRIVETTNEGIWLLDENFKITFVNKRFAEMLGYGPKDMVGRNLTAFSFAEDLPEILAMRNRRKQGSAEHYEWRFRRRDGSDLWVNASATAIMSEENRFLGSFTMVTDITERKNAEETLREKEKTLRALLDASPETALLIDTNFIILASNKTAAGRFGMSLEEYIGSDLFSRHSDASEARRRCEMIIKARETKQLVRLSDMRAGRSYDAYYNPIINEDGEVDKVAVFAMDVTEHKILEERLLEVCDMERQRIGQDIHDSLGQHLTGIMLTATLLHQKLNKKSLPEASEAAKLMSMIKRAMTISRGLAKGLCPVAVTGDILSAIKELASGAEDIYKISCNFTYAYTIPITDSVTATHLYRIAQEALNNAVNHGHAKHVKIELVALDDSITLSIEDDGVGIKEDIARGQGMGLYIMENRARAINGSLDVQRNSNGGTTVIFATQGMTVGVRT